MNQLKYPLILTILFSAIALLQWKGLLEVGKTINEFFPCEQNPRNSAPCYIDYDIVTFFVFISLATVSLVWLDSKYLLFKTRK